MQIGENIRKARCQKNFTQLFVAKKSGLSATAYGDIERGKTDISWSRLEKIAAALGVTVEYIVNLSDFISNLNS